VKQFFSKDIHYKNVLTMTTFGEQEWGGGEGGQGQKRARCTHFSPSFTLKGELGNILTDQGSLSNEQSCTFVVCAQRSLA